MNTGCYIHIPFCRQRCNYCDFNTYVGLLTLQDEYVSAILEEIERTKLRNPGLRVNTLYFGGGTPSLLSVDNIKRIISRTQRSLMLPKHAEITLEANPGTIDDAKMKALNAAGLNRISLGVQSSHSSELLFLGRNHTWQEAVDVYYSAINAGFENISIDLMYGLPGQSIKSWRETLLRVLDLSPQHLSLYALTLETGTPLALTLLMENISLPDADLAADMYDIATHILHSAGYWQYEISNWAKAHREVPAIWALPPDGVIENISPYICHHNIIYWRNETWIGFGAGAHSWFNGRRFSQHPHPKSYINAVKSGKIKGAHHEYIAPALAQDETLILGLRLVEGVSDSLFYDRWGVSLFEEYAEQINKLTEYNLLSQAGDRIRLSPSSRLLGNQIFQEFLR
jgi:oxygen-independent coproporphyrinogen-3 oxidase